LEFNICQSRIGAGVKLLGVGVASESKISDSDHLCLAVLAEAAITQNEVIYPVSMALSG